MLTTKAWVRLVLIVAAFVIFGPRSSAQTISCSSDDGHRHYCPADTRGGVQLVKQRSDSPCQQGYSWGFDRGGVWVDRGCRADFAVSAYQYRGPVGGGGGGGVTISCSSDDGGRHYCPATPGRVQLIQQRSQSACREGYSWGRTAGASGWIMAAGPIFQWIHTSTAVAGLEEDQVAVGLFPALLTTAGGTIARPTAVDGFNWRDNAANPPVQRATAGAKTDAAFGWITVAGPTSMLAADGTAVAGIETVRPRPRLESG